MTDLAWLAGFYEGEGTLRINRASARHLGIVHASVVSTERAYVDAVIELVNATCPQTDEWRRE